MSGPEDPSRPPKPDRGLASRLRLPDPHAAKRSMASAYQGAVEAVVAMVICALAGWWIDGRFGTGPWGLFVGMALGFAALLLRLLRIKTPTIGRPEQPAANERGQDEADDRDAGSIDAGWTQVLTPNRDRDGDRDDDEESGGPPESR